MPQINSESVSSQNLEIINSLLETALSPVIGFKSIGNTQEDDIEDFECILANDFVEELSFFEDNQIIGRSLLKDFPTEFKKYGSDFSQVIKTGVPLSKEIQIEVDQTQESFKMNVSKISNGVIISLKRLTQELELKSKKKRYKKLFEESLDAIFVADSTFKIIDYNEEMCLLSGYTKEELIGKTLSDVFHGGNNIQNKITNHFNVNKNATLEELEWQSKNRNGKKISLIINVVKLREKTKKGKIENFYQGVIKDITKRKKAEHQLLQAQKVHTTGKIARSIAHEVRNPLTNLTLALDQLKHELNNQSEDSDLYISIMSRNIQRINNLITELLESSKPKDLSKSSKNINDIIRKSIDIVKDRLTLSEIGQDLHLDDTIPLIKVDEELIQMALVNIFINAAEAVSPKTGMISVKTTQNDENIILEIKDNGKGIIEDKIEQLFDPFFSIKKGGMGLGLTAVQNVIQSHDGEISVESKQSVGTTFYIYLPKKNVE